MKLTSKLLVATLALSTLGTAPAFADGVRRIVHANGEATYVAEPAPRGQQVERGATIGVYAGDRSFSETRRMTRTSADMPEAGDRAAVPFHRGRGQVE